MVAFVSSLLTIFLSYEVECSFMVCLMFRVQTTWVYDWGYTSDINFLPLLSYMKFWKFHCLTIGLTQGFSLLFSAVDLVNFTLAIKILQKFLISLSFYILQWRTWWGIWWWYRFCKFPGNFWGRAQWPNQCCFWRYACLFWILFGYVTRVDCAQAFVFWDTIVHKLETFNTT